MSLPLDDVLARIKRNRNVTSTPPLPPCVVCGGLGWTSEMVEEADNLGDSYWRTIMLPCSCQEQSRRARREQIFRRSDLGELAAWRFETLRPNRNQAPGYVCGLQWARDPYGILALLGPYGRGKSILAACIGFEACARMTPRFVRVPELLISLRQTFNADAEETFAARMKGLSTAALLIMDDLGSEVRTEWSSEQVFTIIASRQANGLPTVITTNRTLNGLGERLASRLRNVNHSTIVVVDGPDLRDGVEALDTWAVPYDPAAVASGYELAGEGSRETVVCPCCHCRPCLGACPVQLSPHPKPAPARHRTAEEEMEFMEASGLCPHCGASPGRPHGTECHSLDVMEGEL